MAAIMIGEIERISSEKREGTVKMGYCTGQR